jgi:hypothetical protein
MDAIIQFGEIFSHFRDRAFSVWSKSSSCLSVPSGHLWREEEGTARKCLLRDTVVVSTTCHHRVSLWNSDHFWDQQTMPLLRRYVAGLLPQWSEFDRRPVRMRVSMDEVALRQAFLPVFRCQYHSTNATCSFICLSPTVYIILATDSAFQHALKHASYKNRIRPTHVLLINLQHQTNQQT